MDEPISSGETVNYDEYGMRLRVGRDPGLRMEDTSPTISDIGDSGASAPSQSAGAGTPPEGVVPTSIDNSPEEPTISDIDGLDTTDLDDDDDGDDLDDSDDLDDDESVASYDNLEAANRRIAKLNHKNATQRVALKNFNDAFGNFNETEQGQLLGLVAELGTSPETAAQKLVMIGNAILGTEEGQKTEALTPTDDLDQPLTLRQLQEREAKQQQDQAFARDVENVFADARERGYADNTPEQRMFLGFLANEAEGDSEIADQMFKKFVNGQIKGYISGKRTQAASATANPSEGLQTETESHAPKTFKEATSAAMARMNSRVGQ